MKNLLFFFLIFMISNSFGQEVRAELVFKDGTVLNGFAEPTEKSTIRFRKELKGKKQFFSYQEVDTLKFYQTSKPLIFVWVKVKDRANPLLLELKQNGKKIKNFRRVERDGKKGGTVFVPTISLTTGQYGVSTHYSKPSDKATIYTYLQKANDEEAIYLGSNGYFSKNFKKEAVKYFADCPKLVAKIERKLYKRKDINNIIWFYNNYCE